MQESFRLISPAQKGLALDTNRTINVVYSSKYHCVPDAQISAQRASEKTKRYSDQT